MGSDRYELKIGIFIFVGLILLVAVTFSIGDFLFKPGYTVKLILNFADGVQEAAPVRLAGVEVGEVKKARIYKERDTKETKVELSLWLTSDAAVEEDATVVVNTLGLIGEKYVEILPGTPGASLLEDGDIITGHDSVSMHKVTRKGYDVLTKVDDMVTSINVILNKVKSKEGTVGKLFMDQKLYDNIEEISEDVKALVKDIKRHPWKLLARPKDDSVKKSVEKDEKQGRGGVF